MQPIPNGARELDVSAAFADVARIYRSITGNELPRGGAPARPIPPERVPSEVAREALEELGQLLHDRGAPASMRLVPPADCLERDGELEIALDLPGVSREGIEVRIAHGALSVVARRAGPPEGWRAAALERPAGRFERTIVLPTGVRIERAEASLEQGVLRVRLHVAPGLTEPRTIEIR